MHNLYHVAKVTRVTISCYIYYILPTFSYRVVRICQEIDVPDVGASIHSVCSCSRHRWIKPPSFYNVSPPISCIHRDDLLQTLVSSSHFGAVGPRAVVRYVEVVSTTLGFESTAAILSDPVSKAGCTPQKFSLDRGCCLAGCHLNLIVIAWCLNLWPAVGIYYIVWQDQEYECVYTTAGLMTDVTNSLINICSHRLDRDLLSASVGPHTAK